MEKGMKKIESTGTGLGRIQTKLKFIKSDKNGALISFVSQNPVNGIVCGVRKDSPYPKKIVIIDRKLSNDIIANVLYDCTLIPMHKTLNENTGWEHVPGYIAIEATPVQFKATVATSYIRGIKYTVEVSFGNKIIRFDPYMGQKESVKSLSACKAILEKRYDVKNLMEVIDDFNIAANNIVELMKQDMEQLNGYAKAHQTNRRDSH